MSGLTERELRQKIKKGGRGSLTSDERDAYEQFVTVINPGILVKREKAVRIAALEHLGIDTLETQDSDDLDFHEVSVVSLEAALKYAYECGLRDTQMVGR